MFFKKTEKRSHGDKSTKDFETTVLDKVIVGNHVATFAIIMQFLTKCDSIGAYSVKKLFSGVEIPVVPLKARIKDSVKIWQTLTRDQKVLEVVKGWGSMMISKEVKELLNNGAIASVKLEESQFLTLLPKKMRIKLETSKPVRTPSAFQNGGSALPQRTLYGKGLYTQARFLRTPSFLFRWTKTPVNFSVRQPIPIHMRYKVKVYIHKVNKNTCGSFASDKYTFDNIFGRHVDPW